MDPFIKTLQLHNRSKPIWLEYSDGHTFFGDTPVTIYDEYKLCLVLTDDCGAVIGDKIFFPKRGDVMLFRPSEVHFGRFPKSSEYTFISFMLPVDLFEHIFPQDKQLLAPFFDNSPHRQNLLRLPQAYRKQTIRIAEEMLQLMRAQGRLYTDVLLFAKLVEVLDICNQCYGLQQDLQHTPPLVAQALRQIDAQFPEFTGLEALAKNCGCSTTHLTQMFRRHTGKSIYTYLTQRRLEQARRLLQQGLTVTEACYQSGFSDCSRFILTFQKHFGMTPGAYKKNLAAISGKFR